jgi:hypothetical protein
MLGFIANATGMLGSVLTASLTIMGARIPRRAAATSFSAPD